MRDAGDVVARRNAAAPSQCGALQKSRGSGLRGAQGQVGDVERGEQHYALRDRMWWRWGSGHRGGGNAGKDMMAARMYGCGFRRLPLIVLRKICGVVMRGNGNGVMVPGSRRCGVGPVSRVAIKARCRWRKRSQALYRQGQHQQPDGNQSHGFHRDGV